MSGHIFVYGTLRSDCADLELAAPGQEARALVRDCAVWIAPATVSGRLHAVSWYPALTRGRGIVQGEVWRMHAGDRLLPALDVYEGEDYERAPCRPRLPDGRMVRAVVWRYVAPLRDAPRIDSGDYRSWAETRYVP